MNDCLLVSRSGFPTSGWVAAFLKQVTLVGPVIQKPKRSTKQGAENEKSIAFVPPARARPVPLFEGRRHVTGRVARFVIAVVKGA
jgi:hypothetical protein